MNRLPSGNLLFLALLNKGSPSEVSMNELKDHVVALPTLVVEGRTYLSYQAATDTVAAFCSLPRPPARLTRRDTGASWRRPMPFAAS
jgi:hypothetical protein